jgi:hypothetical protein
MVADVSAVADPSTGVAVYNTYGGAAAGATGWAVFGGTSAAAPIVASILAATGKGAVDNSWPYAHAGAFYDVTSGTNGSCSGKYLCTSGAGYDGPTGLGAPNGAVLAASGGTSTTTGGGAGTCGHDVCATGVELTSTCDACAASVCAADSYCCATKWDSICVGEVATYCSQTCN